MDNLTPSGLEAVGWAVEVYWPEEEEWFSGEIMGFDEEHGYHVQYDDGDVTWEPVSSANIRFTNLIAQGSPKKSTTKPEAVDPPVPVPTTALEPPVDEDSESCDSEGDTGIIVSTPVESHAEDDTTNNPTNTNNIYKSSEDEDSEELQVPDMSRNDLLKHFEKVAIEAAKNSFTSKSNTSTTSSKVSISEKSVRPGPGKGTLTCRILEARDLGQGTDPFVKLSFVEPGRKSMMLRCKTTIHSTKIQTDQTDPDWSAEEPCVLQVDPYYNEKTNSDGSNWDRVQGDLLFSVYDWCNGVRNEFIGQVCVCIRDLVSADDVDTIFGGPQEVFESWIGLVNRSGRPVSGSLLIQLQLSLPEGDDDDDDIDDVFEEIRLQEKQKQQTRALSTQETLSRKKTTKKTRHKKNSATHLEDIFISRAKVKAHNTARIKQMRQEKLDQDNAKIAKRLQAFATKKKSSSSDKEKDRRLQLKTRKSEASVAAASKRKHQKRSELVLCVDTLQQEVSDLQSTVSTMKSRATRCETQSKRLEQSVSQLERKVRNANQQRRQNPTILSKDGYSSSRAESSVKGPSGIVKEQVELLLQEKESLVETKHDLTKTLESLQSQEDTYERRLEQLQQKLNFAAERKTVKSPTKNNSSAYQTIRQLKIDIEVLKQAQSLKSKSTTNTDSANNNKAEVIAEKCSRKALKIEHEEMDRDRYQSMYEKLLQSNTRKNLEMKISELQQKAFALRKSQKASHMEQSHKVVL